MKRFLCAVLVLMTLIGIMPNLTATTVSAAETQTRYCYEATPAVTKAAFQYLDEIYIEKFPELALEYSFGSGKDKKTLKSQAAKIVSGIETDEAKAYAIVDWVTAKIEYVSYMSGEAKYFAIDTYYAKKGNCLGISQLIVQLCRLSGVKAVMCCGTRGDMRDYITLENREMDHAWAMIYYNNNWHLFDPLFSVYGSTDKSFISRWYFTDFIEGVSPYVKEYASYINYGDAIFYIDGRFVHYKNGAPASEFFKMASEGGTAVNWAIPYFALNRYDNKYDTGEDGYEYIDDPSRKQSMINDECFSNGWVTYGPALYYTKPNGIRAGSTFKTENGKCYYLPFGASAIVLPGKSTDYTFTDGCPTLLVGSTLSLHPIWEEDQLENDRVIVWSTTTPETIKVTKDGQITALSEGYACATVCSKDTEDDDTHYLFDYVEFWVSAKERTVKYSSNIDVSKVDIQLSKTSYTYDGKVKTPNITVKNAAGRTLKEGVDYTVTYASGRKDPGTYEVTVQMKGVYTGTKILRFKIASKLAIATQPKTQKIKSGETVKFTVKATGAGLKYQWQSSSDGKTWKNCSSSSATKATFSFTSKSSHSSNYYRCKVTDSAGNTVYTNAVRLYVLDVTYQPKTQKVEAGEKVKFTVTATGAGKTYQWQVSTDGKTWKNITSTASAKKATLSFTSKTAHSGNYYRCRIKDSGGNTVYTDAVRLYVLGITEQPVSKTVTKGKTAKFTVEATGAGKVYQWQYSTDGGKTWKNITSTASAKKATLSFSAKTTHNGNYYRCRIKDSGGNTVYTSKVKLTVKK